MDHLPITSGETLARIMQRPRLAAAREHISLGASADGMSVAALHRMYPNWIEEDMLYGLNRLWDIACREETYVYPLWPEASGQKQKVSLVRFPAEGEAPFVLLCAGGAYCSAASLVEAFPIAARLNELGYHAFVLEYRCGGEGLYPDPMEDLAQAIRFILENAAALKVKPDNYALCGMSAGGHLVSTVGAGSMRHIYGDIPKPAALFLGYPVVTMGAYTHELSRQTLLGTAPAPEAVDALSMEKQVSADYPPVYLWQCRGDDVVPFENSLLLQAALERCGVKHRFKPVEGTAHSWALASGTAADGWLEEAVAFWRNI